LSQGSSASPMAPCHFLPASSVVEVLTAPFLDPALPVWSPWPDSLLGAMLSVPTMCLVPASPLVQAVQS
ncbi:hypothetical protein C0993_005697, partial [Termitomyces sp. T159_Od127]